MEEYSYETEHKLMDETSNVVTGKSELEQKLLEVAEMDVRRANLRRAAAHELG